MPTTTSLDQRLLHPAMFARQQIFHTQSNTRDNSLTVTGSSRAIIFLPNLGDGVATIYAQICSCDVAGCIT